jgi:hypothetical protein
MKSGPNPCVALLLEEPMLLVGEPTRNPDASPEGCRGSDRDEAPEPDRHADAATLEDAGLVATDQLG